MGTGDDAGFPGLGGTTGFPSISCVTPFFPCATSS